MKIENVKVYDLEESLIAAGYPVRTKTVQGEFGEKDLARGKNLAKLGGAHAQFLTGVRVAFDLTCSNKMWVEAERYRFLEFVSSQSTIHSLTKFALDEQYNQYVDSEIIEIMEKKILAYNHLKANRPKCISDKDYDELLSTKYLEILYSNPAGFELTARLTTNYRCLKNIYSQRYNHILPEWREFCQWIETLPYADELLLI